MAQVFELLGWLAQYRRLDHTRDDRRLFLWYVPRLMFSTCPWLTIVAQFFSAAGVIGSAGSYDITPWNTYLIFVAVLTYGTLVNLFGNRYLGQYNNGACM
jgi:amino acid transporter